MGSVSTQLGHSDLSSGYLHSLVALEVRQKESMQIGALAFDGYYRLPFDTAFDINAERYLCCIRYL